MKHDGTSKLDNDNPRSPTRSFVELVTPNVIQTRYDTLQDCHKKFDNFLQDGNKAGLEEYLASD